MKRRRARSRLRRPRSVRPAPRAKRGTRTRRVAWPCRATARSFSSSERPAGLAGTGHAVRRTCGRRRAARVVPNTGGLTMPVSAGPVLSVSTAHRTSGSRSNSRTWHGSCHLRYAAPARNGTLSSAGTSFSGVGSVGSARPASVSTATTVFEAPDSTAPRRCRATTVTMTAARGPPAGRASSCGVSGTRAVSAKTGHPLGHEARRPRAGGPRVRGWFRARGPPKPREVVFRGSSEGAVAALRTLP